MNSTAITFSIFLLLNPVFAKDVISPSEQLKAELQNYRLPTPEQILTAGFKLQESALDIIEQKNKGDCLTQNVEKVENTNKPFKDKCFICTVINSENNKEYQVLMGRIPNEKNLDSRSPLFSPNEISVSYSGTNDQPFHGALEPIKPIGYDWNGHTYGSNFNLTADYDWGTFSVDAGSDLYVSDYHFYVNGTRYMYTTDNGPSRKILQEADEHSYLRFSTKYYLDDRHNKNAKNTGEKFKDPYLKFGMGLEHDSDKGIGFFGGIAHREQWHQMFATREDQYVNHFKDQTSISANAQLGVETYRPIGELGFCSTFEAGLSGNTTGTIKVEALIKAAIDSGTLGGYSRKDPLFVINFEAGISDPIKNGSGPTIESDPTYNTYLNNKNYTLIGNTRNAHSSLGVEFGGDELRLSIDVVYEKNQWNDGDLIYVTTLKKKF